MAEEQKALQDLTQEADKFFRDAYFKRQITSGSKEQLDKWDKELAAEGKMTLRHFSKSILKPAMDKIKKDLGSKDSPHG